jgi:hypothetical protein
MRALLAAVLILSVGSSSSAARGRGFEPDTETVCAEANYGWTLSDGGFNWYVFLPDGGIARCVAPDGGYLGRESRPGSPGRDSAPSR